MVILGVILHAIGGFAAGSFYIPFKQVRKWAGSSRRTLKMVATGILLVFLSTVIVGYGNYLKTKENKPNPQSSTTSFQAKPPQGIDVQVDATSSTPISVANNTMPRAGQNELHSNVNAMCWPTRFSVTEQEPS